MKIQFFLLCSITSLLCFCAGSQALRIPDTTNKVCLTGRKIGATDIAIHYSSPGVKGREGRIYGTNVVPFGFQPLGFGSDVPSPWRAGADECTTIYFSTDVMINGKKLPAGNYAFFIAVNPDSATLIFNKNTKEWGSYFYSKDLDVLRVATIQQKNLPVLQERLVYNFTDETNQSVNINLDWEKWRFPIHVSVDLKRTILESIREQMSGAIGFDPPSLEAAARWCNQNDTNYTEALSWINSAVDPRLGGRNSFAALSAKSAILQKTGNDKDAATIMNAAMDNASAAELHTYGRQLMSERKLPRALEVFKKNYDLHKGAWPTNAGLMRVYSAMGNYSKALEFAKAALPQAPDEPTRKFLVEAIAGLESGKAVQ